MDAAHLFGIDARLPPQPTDGPWPTRYWVRAQDRVPDVPNADACVLAYVSDTCTPLFPIESAHHGPTLTHDVWFHRPIATSEWLLIDLQSRSIADGIGFYVGSVFDLHGNLVASLAQEALFRTDS
jgi:acyl-CoA thioesterase-2